MSQQTQAPQNGQPSQISLDEEFKSIEEFIDLQKAKLTPEQVSEIDTLATRQETEFNDIKGKFEQELKLVRLSLVSELKEKEREVSQQLDTKKHLAEKNLMSLKSNHAVEKLSKVYNFITENIKKNDNNALPVPSVMEKKE